MWNDILTIYADVTSSAEDTYLTKAKSMSTAARSADFTGYNCTSEENETALEALRARSWLALRRKLEEQTSEATILGTLRATFEDRFRYDEQGVPRVWRPEDDIEAAFRKAKDEVGKPGTTGTDLRRSTSSLFSLPLRQRTRNSCPNCPTRNRLSMRNPILSPLIPLRPSLCCLRPRSFPSNRVSRGMPMRHTSKPNDQWSRPSRKSHYGCTEYWSFWAGTRR